MSDRYPIPAGVARSEFSEKNSIFIGTVGPAANIAEAEAFIRQISGQYADAHHNAWAYLIGFGPTARCACHNAGEPGGTAGPPALAALQASGMGDIVVVVTRYFGGVKLGTGGLARAYGRAAREAAANAPRAERVTRRIVKVTLGYHFHDAFRRLLVPYEAVTLTTDYGDSVCFTVQLPVDRCSEFALALRELTAGQADCSSIDVS